MRRVHIDFEQRELDNGLQVILAPDSTVPVVAVNLWYRVGSRNEVPGRTGFAHLFEHMMFQGSAHVPKNRHFELVERAGGSMNATTWFDRTNYFETVPSHQLDLALWLESDRMGWMVEAMTQEKLENQQSVVTEEKKQRYDNQPYGDWDERLQALLFPEDHPYHHTVIGSMEDIAAATLEDVSDFFQTFYVPNNCVLTVAGDIDPDHAFGRVRHYFGEIPRGDDIPPIPGQVNLPEVLGSTVRETVSTDVPLPRVYLAGRIPPYSDDRFYAAQVASVVLGRGRASRFYRGLVRGDRVAKDVGNFAFPLTAGASMFLARATGLPHVTPEDLERAMVREMEGLAEVTQAELDRARALLETQTLAALEEVADRADLLSMFAGLFDDPGRINRELERLQGVTREDLVRFAETFLGSDNRAVLTYIPEAE